jgi:3-oxoacyl-[acyl-carrier-protein] synthase-3
MYNKKAFIKGISYYLPEQTLTNTELSAKFNDWGEEKIFNKTGIKNRHISLADEYASDLAIKAANLLFKEYSINNKLIDFVIYCTQSPDYLLPTTACILQERLNLSIKCGALDFNLGCSGYVYGLAICKGLIESSIASNILFITSETYSKYIHPEDRGNRTIFGDAAAATLISDNGFAEICNFDLGTDGSGAQNLIVKNGGTRYKSTFESFDVDGRGNFRSSSHLFMNGPEIFAFTSKMVPDLIDNVLRKNTLVKDDIDLFIFHQANKFMLDFLRKKIGIPESKFYTYIENCANTVSSTIPIALKEAIINNRCRGSVLLAGFGVGYSWGGTVLKLNNRRND